MTEQIHQQWRPAETPLSRFQWLQISLLSLLAVACGSLAAAVWQTGVTLRDNEAARNRELRGFHANLVREIRRLSENSGMLTSADLCPVRFRVRQQDSWNIPALPVTAELVAVGNADQLIPRRTATNGVVNFGLVPPGRYRLTLWTEGEYRLKHEFDVLPGVPIDRLVLCPLKKPESQRPVRVEMEQLISLIDPDMTLMFYVERDDVTVGEWTWRPVHRQAAWVLPSGTATNRLKSALESTVSEEVLAGVPFVNCRCTALAIVEIEADERNLARPLGTFHFPFEADSYSVSWPEPVYLVDALPPRYRRPILDKSAIWKIELPLSAIREIERRLEVNVGGSAVCELTETSRFPSWRLGTALVPFSVVCDERVPSSIPMVL